MTYRQLGRFHWLLGCDHHHFDSLHEWFANVSCSATANWGRRFHWRGCFGSGFQCSGAEGKTHRCCHLQEKRTGRREGSRPTVKNGCCEGWRHLQHCRSRGCSALLAKIGCSVWEFQTGSDVEMEKTCLNVKYKTKPQLRKELNFFCCFVLELLDDKS